MTSVVYLAKIIRSRTIGGKAASITTYEEVYSTSQSAERSLRLRVDPRCEFADAVFNVNKYGLLTCYDYTSVGIILEIEPKVVHV